MTNLLKILALVLSLLVIVSTTIGVKVYFDHVSPARELSGIRDYSQLLSKVSELTYTLVYGDLREKVSISCESDCRTGIVRVYTENETLVSIITFEYKDGIFLMRKVMPDNTSISLDPIVYMDGIAGGLVFLRDENGTVIDISVFPGLTPLLLPYHVGEKRGIDWSRIARLEGDSVAQVYTPRLVTARVNERNYRGLLLTFEGFGVYWQNHEWFAPRIDMVLVSIDGIPVASSLVMTVTHPKTGEVIEIQITLDSIKKS